MENTPAWHSYKAVCIGGSWYNTTFVKKVIEELLQKAPLVEMGMEGFSKAEVLAMNVLKERGLF